MKALWHSIAPFASDTSGACAVFEKSPALVIALDSNGTVTTLRRVIDIHAAKAQYETIDLPGLSYTLGREGDFQERMLELFEFNRYEAPASGRAFPEFAVLVHGPVSNLVGIDLPAHARTLERTLGIPVLSVETTGNRYYDKGIERAYNALFERFAAHGAGAERDGGCIGILGMTRLDYPGAAIPHELAAGISRRRLRVQSDWGYSDSVDAWRRAACVGSNVVMTASGLALARRMRDELGISYTALCDLDWLDDLAQGLHVGAEIRVLVVGEQISSNVLRRLLRICGVASVDVATFFTLDKEHAEEGDLRLRGEAALGELCAHVAYDLVIGDAVLERLCAGTPLVPLMHPPVGFGKRDNTELSRMWFSRLVRAIDEAAQGKRRL